MADAYRAGSASTRQLLTAVLVWAYGPIGYGPWRAARSLDADPNGKRLAYALEEVSTTAPDEEALRTAYRRFRDPDQARLPWLGPGLCTKVLYFVGYRRGAGGVQPLILDRSWPANSPPRRVSAGATAGHPRSGWPTCAGRPSRPGSAGVEPDAVEMTVRADDLEVVY